MNPFNNRWIALLMVAGVLLIVAELVGTGDNGGVLSRTAESDVASEQAAQEGSGFETSSEAPIILDEVPEDDLPQLATEDDVDDFGDFVDMSDPEMTGESFGDEFSSED